MAGQRFTPIIVGVGDVKDPFTGPDGAEEPLYLILQAIHAAARDTKLPPYDSENLLGEVDSIDVVRTWTWPYDDLAGDVAKEMRAKPTHKVTTARHGGDQPAKLVDEAARRIAMGESKIAVVTGGEALASLAAHMAAKGTPPPHWTKTQHGLDSIFADERQKTKHTLGGTHGIVAPTQIYPLYENAFRAHRGQSIEQNNSESAQMYAAFAQTASQTEHAWPHHGQQPQTAASIGTVTARNRLISFPYPLLMNAFNTVNLAAACILTSTAHARSAGIPESKWIYVRGGAGTRDSDDFLRRRDFTCSPALARSLDGALAASRLTAAEMDVFDFYACFPIVPKLACAHLLGLATRMMTPPYERPISLLGGLTFFGGAGNNYSMHAVTEMCRWLRGGRGEGEGEGRHGLVLANGGVVTYQHAVCLSTVPLAEGQGYPECNPLPEYLPVLSASEIEERPEGEAVVETYTVDFGRDGRPVLGHVVGRLVGSGKRFVANHGSEKTLMELSKRTGEPVGRSGRVRVGGDGKNVFVFEREGKL